MKRLLMLMILLSSLDATEIKRHLNNNSTLKNLIKPTEVEKLSELFSEGLFYGRLRLNSFSFDWDEEVEGKTKDHYTIGLGGSIIFKSAYLNGWGFTTGFYTSQNPIHQDEAYLAYYKVGKGVMSRYKVATQGEYGITALAEAYAEYKTELNSLKIGRQIFESHMTKSNDIKMIPNTFEGVTLHSQAIPNHSLKLAYLTQQKLRDHENFHHLFAYDDSDEPYASWQEQDDTAMHRGITLAKLQEQGIDDELLLFEVENSKKDNLNYMLNYTLLPHLFSSATADVSYRFLANGYTLSPSVRYMKQFDHGAGAIGGANLKTNNIDYTNPNSVEASLYGARFDIGKDRWRIRTGFSRVSNHADIISPWRAFPTNGYGYTLLQYNWYSNTSSYVIQGDYNFKEQKLHAQMRYGIQDFDDKKAGVQADSNVLQFDFIKGFESLPNLYAKLRMVRVEGDGDTVALDGTKKLNPSYRDIRFELNYLF